MRFKRINAISFGRLNKWESPEFNKSITVFYGQNESGKTTVFNLISTILYGWHPVLNNPYIPWDGGKAECKAEIIDNEGHEITIYRNLKNKAEGELISEGKNIRIGNNVITSLSQLPQELFDEIYSLSLDKMCFPDSGIWHRLQDQILGGQIAPFLRPMNMVMQEIESEANSLWRSDRQGKPKDKRLFEQLKELKLRLVEAEANEKSMHETEQKHDTLTNEIAQLMDQKTKSVAFIDRFERLYPVYKKIVKVEEFKALSGNVDQYGLIPENPMRVLKELQDKSSALSLEHSNMLIQKQKEEKRLSEFTASDRSIYENCDDIRTLVRSHNLIESDLRVLSDIENEISKYKDRLYDRAKDFIYGGWKKELAESVFNIDEAELRTAIEIYKKINLQCQNEEAKITGLKVRIGQKNNSKLAFYISLVSILSGIVMILAAKNPLLTNLSLMLITIGICLFAARWFYINENKASIEIKESQRNLSSLIASRNKAVDSVANALRGLPIAELRLNYPEESLLVDVNILKDLLYQLYNNTRKKEIIIRRLRESQDALNRLLVQCDIEAENNIVKDISRLERCLTTAESRYYDSEDAKIKLEYIESQLSDIGCKENKLNAQIKNITDGVQGLAGSNIEEKLLCLEERRTNLKKSQSILEELEHDYPDLEEIIKQIKESENDRESWTMDIERIARVKTEIGHMDLQLNRLNEDIGSLKKELEHRQKYERVDDIKGQIIIIEQEREDAARKRDKLVLMKNLLMEADKRYREENQPDVLQKAGSYIEIISGGRYNKIFTREDGEIGLTVKSDYTEGTIDVSQPLSRGIQEQIYLSLRFAFLDHIDTYERLPVFLDEVLVNWDDVRVNNVLRLLDSIGQNRQVFLFTCHKELADLLESVNGAQVINL